MNGILKALVVSGFALLLLGGCAVSGPYVPKQRNYDELALKYPAAPGTDFFDSRAFHELDVIVLRVERAQADRVEFVPAVVKKVLPNGNLLLEGHQKHFFISGVVRPLDIAIDNSVRSAYLADAEIVFTGA